MLGRPSHRLEKHLEEHGKRANAVVVEIAHRGMAVTNGAEGVIGNTTLALKTKLRVEPDGELAFEIEQRFRYGQLAVPTAGMRVGVVYDPDDHDKIMLDETAPFGIAGTRTTASGIPADPASLLAAVQEAQAQSGGDRQQLAQILRERFAGQQGVAFAGGAAGFGAPAVDPLDRLAKAAKLHEQGVLTDEEFAAQKAKILGE